MCGRGTGLTVVRDVFPSHLSQGRPEDPHTTLKHQETTEDNQLVLKMKQIMSLAF